MRDQQHRVLLCWEALERSGSGSCRAVCLWSEQVRLGTAWPGLVLIRACISALLGVPRCSSFNVRIQANLNEREWFRFPGLWIVFIALYIFQGVLVECFCNARAVKGCVVLAACWCFFCLLCSVRSAVRLVGLEITGAQALLTKHLLAPSLASCLNLQLTSVHTVPSGRAGE